MICLMRLWEITVAGVHLFVIIYGNYSNLCNQVYCFLSLSGLIDYAAALFGFDCLGSVFWMLAWRGEGEIAGRLFEKTSSGSLEDDTELASDFQNVWN